MTGTCRHAHTDALWGLGAWLPGLGLVLTLVADRGRPGVGPAGCLGQRGVSCVPSLHPPNPPGAQGGGYRAVLTPGQYTHHPRCPHLIRTLQRVVDEVSMPMWMPGRCSGTTPILVRGHGGPRAGAMAAPTPLGGGV